MEPLPAIRRSPRWSAGFWFFIFRFLWAVYWSQASAHASSFLFSLHFGWIPILSSSLVAGALGYFWGYRILEGPPSLPLAVGLGVAIQFATTLLYLPAAVSWELLIEAVPFSQFLGRLYLSYVFSLAGIPIHLLLGGLTGAFLYLAAGNPNLTSARWRKITLVSCSFILVAIGVGNLVVMHRRSTKTVLPAPDPLAQSYVYVQAHDWRSALDAAKRAIQAAPGRAEGYHLAGLAAGQLYGLHSGESRAYYAKYVELEPDPAKKTFVRTLFPDLIK